MTRQAAPVPIAGIERPRLPHVCWVLVYDNRNDKQVRHCRQPSRPKFRTCTRHQRYERDAERVDE
jgi:hypothetical protein